MKTFMSKPLVWIAACVILFAFSPKPGGDSYKVFLDDKLVLENFVHNTKSDISVPVTTAQNQLSVFFNHCGKMGTSRSISIRDQNNIELKQWKFIDDAAMTVSVKDVAALKKPGKNLRLFYSSKEIPMGQFLATLQFSGPGSTAMN